MNIDRAAFLAWTALLAGCPSPKEPTPAPTTDDAGTTDAAPKHGFTDDADDDPYPIDVAGEFPGPGKEGLGSFRPKVGCAIEGWKGATGPMQKARGPGKVPVYGKEGAECFDAWPCVGTDDVSQPPISCKEALMMCTGEGMSVPRGECARTRNLLKPRVAARAIDCMARVNHWYCDEELDRACRELALVRACDDSTADVACARIEADCPSVERKACRAYLSGLTDDGRAFMVTCMRKDATCNFATCSDALDGGW